MDLIKIGKFLSELRHESNLTQEQLGAKIGVTSIIFKSKLITLIGCRMQIPSLLIYIFFKFCYNPVFDS